MVRYAKLVFFFFSPMVAHPLLVGWANIGWGASGTARPDNAVSCLRPHSLWGAPILDRLLFVFCKLQLVLMPFHIHGHNPLN